MLSHRKLFSTLQRGFAWYHMKQKDLLMQEAFCVLHWPQREANPVLCVHILQPGQVKKPKKFNTGTGTRANFYHPPISGHSVFLLLTRTKLDRIKFCFCIHLKHIDLDYWRMWHISLHRALQFVSLRENKNEDLPFLPSATEFYVQRPTSGPGKGSAALWKVWSFRF